ncbi:hypothetical protein GPEL0_01f1624 [Geoanaerobacter pelophilus]|uniref:Uncharacterized protein n=1 Tax=Geoanaerobacter pelophilus TaxID=60036 RepID=A0ABQ0MJI0_9BACT|nr:hypothetical protein GPEL0_01f1624 [Geoanaerobacter pelophilus]
MQRQQAEVIRISRQEEKTKKRSAFANRFVIDGGADQDRTDDLLNAIQALSQLSYSPI